MPVTKELIGADALAGLTGKSFTLDGVGTGKAVTLLPSPGPDGVAAGHKIILSKGTAIEGITKTTATMAKAPAAQTVTPVVVQQGAGGKIVAAKTVAPTLVQIEGAGKVVGMGKGTTAIQSLEITGTLQPGAAGGSKVLLTGGEMKVVQATGAKAGQKAAVVKGGNGVAMAQAGTGGNATVVKGVAGANINGGAGIASKAATTTSKVSAATGGTIWTGKGMSLGLGLGLGAWGPVLLAAVVATGGYAYYKKRQSQKFWPF